MDSKYMEMHRMNSNSVLRTYLAVEERLRCELERNLEKVVGRCGATFRGALQPFLLLLKLVLRYHLFNQQQRSSENIVTMSSAVCF